MKTVQTPSSMEPMMPSEGTTMSTLCDVAIDLITKSEKLKSQCHPVIHYSLGNLVREMNCYYSNLIEGHHTHPYDIERALGQDFSQDPYKRNLQIEAKAHIEVQEKIDNDKQLANVTSQDFFSWLHKEFYSRLPEEMCWIENPETHERKRVIPGSFRDGDVRVGYHIPIDASLIPTFLRHFTERYNIEKLNRMQQVIAIAASHHRLLWIHPFYDGNGRVARLFSHAFLKQIGVGSRLWSISRGLARNHIEYKKLLMAADMPRQGNYDGRGALTQAGLNEFCSFFLHSCIDQIEFMQKLLQPNMLLERMERWTQQQIESNNLPRGCFPLLKEALMKGEFERGQAPSLTHYKERQARTVLKALLEKKLLISNTPKGRVTLGFPTLILEEWFPKLYIGG